MLAMNRNGESDLLTALAVPQYSYIREAKAHNKEN